MSLASIIQTLIPQLPRYAEEEGDFYAVPRTELVNALCQQSFDRAAAENTIGLIETLLDTLAVLHSDYLQKGEWCFVSFPAQLLALSLLTAWGDPDSRFFAANFWNTQGIADARKDEQRDILHGIETRRFEHHASHAAKPIRYIYVAWSIIKIDGKILFYQREDTRKRHDKQAGDYGLVGGRLNQRDVLGRWPADDLLKELQSENSAVAKAALPETLKRELLEETGLEFELHYQFQHWRSLKPYRQVQGAAPNHALTGYHLDIYCIELTLDGYLLLQQQLKQNERLAWFTLDEMARGKTSDGKIAYLNALFDDFADDRLALKNALTTLPDSFAAGYLFQPYKYGLTLRRNGQAPELLAGTLGKEKPLNLLLTERQFLILLGLAAHLRGFEFGAVEEAIVFHPYGWVDVRQHPELPAELAVLANLLKDHDVMIENHQDRLFRLSVSPEVVYFDDTLFTFRVTQDDLNSVNNKIPVDIHRAVFMTVFGEVKAKTETFKLPFDFVHRVQRLAKASFVADNEEAVKTEDAYKKGLHKDEKFLALGLKSLIRRDAGIMKFVPRFESPGVI